MKKDKMSHATSKEIVETYLDFMHMHKIIDRRPGKSRISNKFLTDIINRIIDDKMSKIDALLITLTRYLQITPGISGEVLKKDYKNCLILLKILDIEDIVDKYITAYENGSAKR